MKTEVKELLEEAYNSKDVCPQWKDKILKVCPDLKISLEVGRWYKSKLGSIFNYQNEISCYGNNYKIGWIDSNWVWVNAKGVIPATREEVESILIAEAIKRGLWNNENIICACLGCKRTSAKLFYLDQDSTCLWGNNGAMFHNGKWAEIIENPIQKEIDNLQKQLDKLKEKL